MYSYSFIDKNEIKKRATLYVYNFTALPYEIIGKVTLNLGE